MFWKLLNRKITHNTGLFDGHFMEAKAFYAFQFNAVACVHFISDLDISKAFTHISDAHKDEICRVYQHSFFDHSEQKVFFNNTIFVLRGKRMIELAGNYCQVLHSPKQYGWANDLVRELAAFRLPGEDKTIGFARQKAMN